ncbi:MAG: hypothetical protein JNN15_09685 [Blastocatellia bacterium]|nr:hypothetical protein [Blastocatellia bacterium]
MEQLINATAKQFTLLLANIFEFGLPYSSLKEKWHLHMARLREVITIAAARSSRPQAVVGLTLAVLILAISFTVRFDRPLSEMRLGHPESYAALLNARQIVAGDRAGIDIFSALVAAISLISSCDPIQVVRFLPPIISLLTLMMLFLIVKRLTDSTCAALVSLFTVGAYIFTIPAMLLDKRSESELIFLATLRYTLNEAYIRQWSGSQFEVGILFVLFIIYTAITSTKIRVSGLLPLILAAYATPTVAALALLAALFLLILQSEAWKRVIVVVFCLLATIIAGLYPLSTLTNVDFSSTRAFLLTLPIWTAIIFGCLFALLARVSFYFEYAAAISFITFSLFFLLPSRIEDHYVEYDITARKTYEISQRFARREWLVVAPVEQLAEVYGLGWYEDLAKFTQQQQLQNVATKHTFVFVEKKPFVFRKEEQSVGFQMLTDPTYRFYRSAAGRASIEFAALKLCEELHSKYQKDKRHSYIYYEDEAIRIYHFEKK